jgi:segregation and condensation protein B
LTDPVAEARREVEALLFLSPGPLSVVELCEVTGRQPGPVQRALTDLAERHGEGAGLEVAEVAGGFVLRTRADLVEVCDRLRERPSDERVSAAALETLAVIAYLGPIGRPEIGRLRGVAVDSTVNSLLERGLIEEAGRPRGGGAMRYRTTREFEERFGLRGLGDLPPLEDFELSGEEAERVRRRLIDGGHLEGVPGPAPDPDGPDE